MQNRREPFDLPEWHALRREANLISQLIGVGATAIGQANYASGLGHYYTAFFGLSVGIERLAKLILIADYIVSHSGNTPRQQLVKSYGHDLIKLSEDAHLVAERRKLILKYSRPTDAISNAALSCLNNFASASQGRYANFSALSNPSYNPIDEPVAKWWHEVVELILDKHFRGKRVEKRVKLKASIMESLIGDIASVRHFAEGEAVISKVAAASERTGMTKFAQKYSRFYTLCIARWLMDVYSELTLTVGYQKGFEVLFGHYEFFASYRSSNNFLLARKLWPLG